MAKIKFLIADVIGKVGGLVFQRGGSGPILRSKGAQIRSKSPGQSMQRSRFASVSRRWGSVLSDAQRAGWRALAATHTITDVFGDPMQLSGYALFCQLNNNLLTAAQSLIDDAPVNLYCQSITEADFGTHDVGEVTFDVEWSEPLEADHHLWIQCQTAVPPGKEYVADELPFSGTKPGAGLTVATVDVPPDQRALIEGLRDWCVIRPFNTVNGVKGVGLVLSGFPAVIP